MSGDLLDVYLKKHIFDPLGMVDTGFFVPEEKLDRLAAVYGPRKGGGIEELDTPEIGHYKRAHTFFSGSGGLVSTGADYLRFCQMLLDHGVLEGVRLLAPRTVGLMTKNHLPESVLPSFRNRANFRTGGYGLAIAVVMDEVETGTLAPKGSSYWGGAASTYFWIDPENDLIGILLTQFMPAVRPIRPALQIATYQALMG